MVRVTNVWLSSTKRRKQRSFRAHAPQHLAGRFMHSPISKDLRKKWIHRSLRVRKGDRVKVMRGRFHGTEGTVDRIDMKTYRVYIDKMEVHKKDGSKILVPIDPSKIMLIELAADDKKRLKRARGGTAA